MSSLENVYCLGCKTRHEKVEIQAIKKMTVEIPQGIKPTGFAPKVKNGLKL